MNRISLIFINLTICTLSFGQITQTHYVVADNIRDVGFVILENSGTKYYCIDDENLILTLYNIDNSIYKTIDIDRTVIGIPEGYNIEMFNVSYISEALFNTDNNIEFLIEIVAFNDAIGGSEFKTIIINEKSELVFEKNNVMLSWDETKPENKSIINTENGTKMILRSINNDEGSSDTLFIMDLPGTLSCNDCESIPTKSIEYTSKSVKLRNYPNPSSDYTTIEYQIPDGESRAEIKIFSNDGKLVYTYQVDKTFNHIQVPTRNLLSGSYIYTIKTESGVTESEKLLVNK